MCNFQLPSLAIRVPGLGLAAFLKFPAILVGLAIGGLDIPSLSPRVPGLGLPVIKPPVLIVGLDVPGLDIPSFAPRVPGIGIPAALKIPVIGVACPFT